MLITTSAEYIWSDRQQKYLLVKRSSINWTGPISLAKGASSQQTQEANASQEFTKNLTQNYNQQFANQNAILGSIKNALSPILAAGPNQFGFSQGELNNLNSQAIQGTGQQYQGAKRALSEQQAAQGGGNAYLPSGAKAAQQASLSADAANNTSNQLLNIQQAGYQQGRQNWQTALGGLNTVANEYDPMGYGNLANQSSNTAFGQATEVQKMNNAASPWNVVGGILGGVGSAFLGGLGGTLGKGLGSKILGGKVANSATDGPYGDGS